MPRHLKFGDRVRFKKIRSRLGWSQARLAEELGVTWNSVARWERGVMSFPLTVELAAEYILLTESKEGE